MSPLLCQEAYRVPGDRRGKIMCRVTGSICAHIKYCDINGKYSQLDSAKDCPGRSENAKA